MRHVDGGVRVGYLWLGVDHLEDSVDRSARELGQHDDRRQHTGRARHRRRVGGEREKRADRDVPVQSEEPAERHHRDKSELRQDCHRRREP